jgi:ubiquinol-cytochrome c reductase iron-sulfur subunit
MSEAIGQEVPRRDFLYVASGAVAGTGALLALWPFLDQMEPGADVVSAGAPVTVNLSSLGPGQQITVLWRSHPIFVVRRTPAILNELKSNTLLRQLRDPASQELQQPEYASNWCRALDPEYLVVIGICTHLGCIPTFMPNPGSVDSNWPGGYLCHCHGSRYDLAGRVFQNVPAPYNLPVPPYSFPQPHILSIGENPKGTRFDLSSIAQI